MYHKISPFFSIIIPCYNQAHFLPDCLDSLLAQDFPDWEAIVVNDGSTDTTTEIALSYTQKDTRIKLVEKVNGGLSSARNYGIQYATGARLIFLDADDFLYSNCLIEIVSLYNDLDDMDLIQYGYTYITEDKQRVLGNVNAIEKKPLIPEIFKGNLGPCHSISISKKLVDNLGGFDENLKSVEDWDFWLRAVKAGGKQKIIQQHLVYYRYSKNSMSRDPFIMYNSLKTVISRGPKKDKRILIESSLNKDFEFDTNKVLVNVLIRSIGVGIMQNNIEESLAFLRNETIKELSQFEPKEFEIMCSYMTFRYWYSPSDIEEVFTVYYPRFEEFFVKAGYDKIFRKKVMFVIFKRHFYYKNRYRFGYKLGSVFNFLLRKIKE